MDYLKSLTYNYITYYKVMAVNQQNQEFEQEYQVIRGDVKKVVITNLLIIILLVGLYFVNQKLGFLDKLQNIF